MKSETCDRCGTTGGVGYTTPARDVTRTHDLCPRCWHDLAHWVEVRPVWADPLPPSMPINEVGCV